MLPINRAPHRGGSRGTLRVAPPVPFEVLMLHARSALTAALSLAIALPAAAQTFSNAQFVNGMALNGAL